MSKSHTYHMFPFEDRPPPLLSGSDTCNGPLKRFFCVCNVDKLRRLGSKEPEKLREAW